MKYRIVRTGTRYQVTGNVPLNLKDYDIDVPSYLGVTVQPDIDTSASFTAERSSASSHAGPAPRGFFRSRSSWLSRPPGRERPCVPLDDPARVHELQHLSRRAVRLRAAHRVRAGAGPDLPSHALGREEAGRGRAVPRHRVRGRCHCRAGSTWASRSAARCSAPPRLRARRSATVPTIADLRAGVTAGPFLALVSSATSPPGPAGRGPNQQRDNLAPASTGSALRFADNTFYVLGTRIFRSACESGTQLLRPGRHPDGHQLFPAIRRELVWHAPGIRAAVMGIAGDLLRPRSGVPGEPARAATSRARSAAPSPSGRPAS